MSHAIQRSGSNRLLRQQNLKDLYNRPPSVTRGLRFETAYDKIQIIGAPVNDGGPLAGAEFGPGLLRKAHLVDGLVDLNYEVIDEGDLNFDPPSKDDPCAEQSAGTAHDSFSVGNALQKVAGAVEICHNRNDSVLPVVLGGDQSTSVGSIVGSMRCHPNLGVVAVGAHADLHTPLSSPTGHIHGMAHGLLMEDATEWDPAEIPGFEWLLKERRLGRQDIVLIALRDLDSPTRRLLMENHVKFFDMSAIDRWGIGEVMERALAHLGSWPHVRNSRPLHLSFDIGAMDPSVALTASNARGGLTYREAHHVCESMSDTHQLCSLDMLEVNPLIHEDASKGGPAGGALETAEIAVSLIGSAVGSRIV